MSERLKMTGHLATVENDINHLELRIKTLRDAIRGKLYLMNPVAEIRGAEILDAAIDLNAKCIELSEKLSIRDELKRALGVD